MTRIPILVALIIAVALPSLPAQDRADALQLYKQGNYAKAVQVCYDEIKELPRNMNSYVVLGWSLLKLGKNQEAVEYGKKALEISRYDNRILQILAEAYYNNGNNLEALKYLEEYATISPTGDLIDEVYYYMGEIFIRLGEYNHADIAFTTAVHYDPNVALWWARLGYAREQAKDFRFAVEAYNKALQLNPNLGDAIRGRQRAQNLLNTAGTAAPAAPAPRPAAQAAPAPRPAPPVQAAPAPQQPAPAPAPAAAPTETPAAPAPQQALPPPADPAPQTPAVGG